MHGYCNERSIHIRIACNISPHKPISNKQYVYTESSKRTNFLYARTDKGLLWQTRGIGGDVSAPIATYIKGYAQDIGESSVKPLLDYYEKAKKGQQPNELETARAWGAAKYLLGLLIAGELANMVWYYVSGALS